MPYEPEDLRVDWNCDSTNQSATTPVAFNLDYPSTGDLHRGFDDWEALDLLFRCQPLGEGLGGDVAALERVAELDPDDALARGELFFPLEVAINILPECVNNPVPPSGTTQKVQVVVWSAPGFDPTAIDPATLRLRGALAESTSGALDLDDDDTPDLVAQFPASGLLNRGAGTSLRLTGSLPDSQLVHGEDLVTWTSTADGDNDGVPSACDLCPSTYAPPPSADGCPVIP